VNDLKEYMWIVALGVICLVLIGFSSMQAKQSLYKFDELGDITVTINEGEGMLDINEIGEFKISISSNEMERDFTIITNETTKGFDSELQGIDFDNLTNVVVGIEWVDISKYQEVEL
jgi:cell division protein YceG involved in septum cleavage